MDLKELQKSEIGFLNHIGGELVEFKEGEAKLSFKIEDIHKQHLGVVHGGAIATLADHTGWYAAVSKIDRGYTCVTIELKVNYLKPAYKDTIVANSKVLNRSKKTVFVVTELFDNDILVAFATATYSIIAEKKEKN